MPKVLNIFFCIDKNFVTHFSVTLLSLLDNNRHIHLNIYVIHDLDNLTPLDRISQFVKSRYNVVLNLIILDNHLFSHYRISHHVSKATYFRLMLADIIPQHVKSGLFLDSDIVITGSLQGLTEIDFESRTDGNSNEYMIYAVRDNPVHDNTGRLKSLGFNAEKYFNAGVMLVNLKEWRRQEVTAKLLAIAEKYMNSLSWWDQDVLNLCFLNQWGELDSTYNALCLTERLAEPPLIIHFAGASKPWHFRNRHPYKEKYFQYLRKRKYRYMSPAMIFAYKKVLKVMNKTLSLNYNEVL